MFGQINLPEDLRARRQDELGAGEGGAVADLQGDVGEGGLVPHPGAVLDQPFVRRCRNLNLCICIFAPGKICTP